mgnify:FL=1
MIRDCELGDEALHKIFTKGCGYVEKDEVIIVARVCKDNKTWSEEKLIKADEKPRMGMKKGFSAMQKATAFPIASVASIMSEGFFDGDKEQHRDYYTKYSRALSYADIPFEKFNENLGKLNDGP